jgi:vacuolar-type H+-ATPase subunit I/STV1
VDKGIKVGVTSCVLTVAGIALAFILAINTDLLLMVISIFIAAMVCIAIWLPEIIHTYEEIIKLLKSTSSYTSLKYFTFSSMIVCSLSISVIHDIKTVFDKATYIIIIYWFVFITYASIKRLEREKEREKKTREFTTVGEIVAVLHKRRFSTK